MREVLNVHLGQAGVQIGERCWELYCLEHGIQPDGTALEGSLSVKSGFENGVDVTSSAQSKWTGHEFKSSETLFQEIKTITGQNRFVPRALFIDSDPSTISELKRGQHKALFNPRLFVSGQEDAGSNFARAYHHPANRRLVREGAEALRRMAESCDSLQGFMFTHSMSGGTGACFSASLAEQISLDFPRKTRLQFTVAPSAHRQSTATGPVEPYNATFCIHKSLPEIECSFLVDNEALYGMYDRFAKNYRLKKKQNPTYSSINTFISQIVAATTASVRFGGSPSLDFNEFQANLVPFARLHFAAMSYSPIVPAIDDISGYSPHTVVHKKHSINSLNNQNTNYAPLIDLTREVFDPRNRLISCGESDDGCYISGCVLYRGDVAPREAQESLTKIRLSKKLRVMDFCSTAFKIGINPQPPIVHPDGDLAQTSRAICMLSNNTVIGSVFKKINQNFRMMFRKRAFVHWYLGEGMEESEISEAYEDVKDLEKEYLALEKEQSNDDSFGSNVGGL